MELNIIIATSNCSYSVTQTVTVKEPKEVQLLLNSSLAASFCQCKAFGPFNNNIDFKTSRRQLSLEDVQQFLESRCYIEEVLDVGSTIDKMTVAIET